MGKSVEEMMGTMERAVKMVNEFMSLQKQINDHGEVQDIFLSQRILRIENMFKLPPLQLVVAKTDISSKPLAKKEDSKGNLEVKMDAPLLKLDNTEQYLRNLELARDKFAKGSLEKRIINTLIRRAKKTLKNEGGTK